MLAALYALAALAKSDQPLSALLADYNPYVCSGEINSTVTDQASVVSEIASTYSGYEQDELDGLTVSSDTWWFNVRASNTEPLLRLNVEGADAETMTSVRDRVLAQIRKG